MQVLKKTFRAALVLAALLALLVPAPSSAEEGGKLHLYEQTIKAGLVYNFLKYTDWPDAPKSGLRVCLYGGGSLAGSLSPLEGRTAQQSVISIARVSKVDETEGCSMVFVGPGARDSLPALLSFLQGKHVLTVSDMDSFARSGGMVEMATEDSRVSLYINKQAVDRAGLSIQARLLKLAKLVSG